MRENRPVVLLSIEQRNARAMCWSAALRPVSGIPIGRCEVLRRFSSPRNGKFYENNDFLSLSQLWRRSIRFTWRNIRGSEHSFDWIDTLRWFSCPTSDYLWGISPSLWSPTGCSSADVLGETWCLTMDSDWIGRCHVSITKSISFSDRTAPMRRSEPFCPVWFSSILLVWAKYSKWSFDSAEVLDHTEIHAVSTID